MQADLIKKFVEGPSVERVRENLIFLADAGLIPDYDDDIRKYLLKNPKVAPQVPSSGSVTGLTAALREPLPLIAPNSKAYGGAQRAVVLLRSAHATCNGFLIAPDRLMTAGYCVNPEFGDMALDLGGDRVSLSVSARVDSTDRQPMDLAAPSYAILKLSRPVDRTFLSPRSRAPRVGEELVMILHRQPDYQLAVSANGCRVTAVHPMAFEFECLIDGGAGGSPVLSKDGSVVLGISTFMKVTGQIDPSRRAVQGWATRMDAVAADALR